MLWFWIILAIFLGIGELITEGFLLLWFALGAGVAAVMAKFLPFIYQLGIFVVISFLLTVLSRTVLNRNPAKTNVSALLGQEALVIETVQPCYCDRGLVKFRGEFWRAYCEEGTIPAGTTVIIMEINGVKLKVAPSKK